MLREEWTGEINAGCSVSEHLVMKQAEKAQCKQKAVYDRSARDRTFEVGQEVLILLPQVGSPLKLE